MNTVSFARTSAAIGLLLSLAAVMSAAQASDLLITHQANADEIRVQHKDKAGRYYKVGEKIKLRARHDEQINIFIADANPLVFTYKLGEQTKTPTADYEALKKVADVLKQILEKQPEVKALGGGTNDIPPPKKTFVLDGIEVDPDSLETNIKSLTSEIAKIGHTIEASLSGPPAGKNVFDVTTAIKAIDALENFSKFLEALNNAKLAPNRRTIESRPTNVPGDDRQSTHLSPVELAMSHPGIQMIFEARGRLGELLDQSRSFIKELQLYQQAAARPFRIGSVQGDSANDVTQPVIIGGTTDGAAIPAVKAFQESHDGVYSLLVSPEQSFHYRISGGLIYSFVRNPEYSAGTDSAGQLVIAETTNDYNELSGALALNIYPDRWFEEGVKWFGQVGVSPAKDANAFLLGAGFNAFEKLTLGAGIVYQQRRELAGGQTIGMTLAKAEDLKVRHRFHTGFYIIAGMSF